MRQLLAAMRRRKHPATGWREQWRKTTTNLPQSLFPSLKTPGIQIISQPPLCFPERERPLGGLWQWNVNGDVKRETNIPHGCWEKGAAMDLRSLALSAQGFFPSAYLLCFSSFYLLGECWRQLLKSQETFKTPQAFLMPLLIATLNVSPRFYGYTEARKWFLPEYQGWQLSPCRPSVPRGWWRNQNRKMTSQQIVTFGCC